MRDTVPFLGGQSKNQIEVDASRLDIQPWDGREDDLRIVAQRILKRNGRIVMCLYEGLHGIIAPTLDRRSAITARTSRINSTGSFASFRADPSLPRFRSIRRLAVGSCDACIRMIRTPTEHPAAAASLLI